MASELVIGKAVEIAITELITAVKNARASYKKFPLRLHELEYTLNSLYSRLQYLRDKIGEPAYGTKNDGLILQRRKDMSTLFELLQKGKELVAKCGTFRTWQFMQKCCYSEKLQDFHLQLQRFIMAFMISDSWADSVCPSENLSVPQLPDRVVGLDVPLLDVKRKLFVEDASALVIWGDGGCGNTMLAVKLCRDNEVKGIFTQSIFFGTSNSFPLLMEKLQSSRGPVLVVLDNLSSSSLGDLQDLMDGRKNMKFVITSREEFKGIQGYRLNILQEDDAITLFCHLAVISANELSEHHHVVQKIVRGCRYLPLALDVIGKSLTRKSWQDFEKAAMELQNVWQIFSGYADIYERLAISLKRLDKQLRECFMDLGAFPEGKKIAAVSVIDMWVETRENLREYGAYDVLQELSKKNLIKLVWRTRNGEDENYDDLYVFQHDLLRELAIYTSRQDQTCTVRLIMDKKEPSVPQGWKKGKGTIKTEIISLHTGEMKREDWFSLKFPRAQVLILNFSADSYSLPPFLKSMENLKFLMVSNNGAKPAKLSGLPLLASLKSLRRIRFENIAVLNFPIAPWPPLGDTAKLHFLHQNLHRNLVPKCFVPYSSISLPKPRQNLKKVALMSCVFGKDDFPVGLSAIFPNLTEIEANYCFGLETLPEEVCKITKLKKLNITKCPDLTHLPQAIDELVDLEVLSIHACTELKNLPSSLCKLPKLKFLDISDCQQMETLPEEIGTLTGLEKMDMRGCLSLGSLPGSVKQMNGLTHVICDGFYVLPLPKINQQRTAYIRWVLCFICKHYFRSFIHVCSANFGPIYVTGIKL